MEDEPDRERVQESARRRQRERAQQVESTLETVEMNLGSHEYPVTGEELAAEYAQQELDLPNETESLGTSSIG